MAIFQKKTPAKKAESKKEVVAGNEVAVVTQPALQKAGKGLDLSMVIVRPHVTEKASDLSEKGVYVFEIHNDANKIQVHAAIEKLFKVKPTKIAIVIGKGKLMRNRSNNRVVVKKTSIKKAFVYLKKGDKIEYV